ncbi:hypothetical protein F511_25720 [Dorcoceras hygrometricum]|uniref:Uncharacterized protein n=1 Tax=Dorcoceras hygrometricum TaxID=472368 RepID=A0A2Z7BAD0_9LAMI|nr:hypothetical protein F511_25720 [Dorcoceras hygrometricum]
MLTHITLPEQITRNVQFTLTKLFALNSSHVKGSARAPDSSRARSSCSIQLRSAEKDHIQSDSTKHLTTCIVASTRSIGQIRHRQLSHSE